MAELEPRFPGFVPMPPPFMREGHNADEPIMIGSSDDEGEGDGRPVGPGRATIAEQRARLHHNRTGTPIPRILEHGLRIMSPPPPLPVHHPPWIRRPDWPHPGQHPQSIHERLANLGVVRSPEAWRRLLGHEHVGRILGFIFPGLADQPQRQQEQPQQVEYDVRMTHSRAKPRLGFTFDFAPDEEEEGGGAAESTTRAGPVRTRTTIVIPDSPPVEPVDRKGKGRARTPPEVAEVLDLESGEWAESVSGPSTSASASTSSPTPRKRRAVETIEILSDDDEGSGDELVPVQGSILVCASCRRPLRMGGGRLWALRCGHMIDSRCYRRLGERPIVQEEAPIPAVVAPVAEPAALRATKRRRVSGGGGRKGKGKPKARPEPVAAPTVVEPYQAETLEWTCPVHRCGRAHWSERMVTAGKSAWQPMKETGAIGVFV